MKQNWVDSLVDESKHVETPHSWLWWSALTCISAAAGNNYQLTTLKGDLIYRPNLYVMLLGESGLGKGYPINRAKLLVNKAEVTRVIAGRSSIQAIVTELATTRSKEGRAPIQDSRGYIVNGELSTAIIADPDSLTILTDLYDGHYNPEWSNMLKGTGTEKLKKPYITALFGSSPAHFYDSIPQANIEGGYIGRNLIIYEEKRSQDVDLLDDESKSESDKFEDTVVPKFVPHLVEIASKQGKLVPNADAKLLFNSWRRKWRASQTHDKTGFLNRVPDHVLKVSMCLSLAEWEITGIISEYHIKEAIDKVTNLVYANKRTTEGRGPDPLAQSTKVVLDFLIATDGNKMVRKSLLRKGWGMFDSFTLDKIIENLLEMGWIQRERVGSDWMYHLSGEPLESLDKWKRGNK